MQGKIITISRQCGSGGHSIGSCRKIRTQIMKHWKLLQPAYLATLGNTPKSLKKAPNARFANGLIGSNIAKAPENAALALSGAFLGEDKYFIYLS